MKAIANASPYQICDPAALWFLVLRLTCVTGTAAASSLKSLADMAILLALLRQVRHRPSRASQPCRRSLQ